MHYGEKFNSITHTVGAGLAVIGGIILIVLGAQTGDALKIVSVIIYIVTLLVLYVFSTLYHSTKGRAKDVLRQFDYCSIYLLIAGTYTPFTLVSLHGKLGWILFSIEWGLALIGIVQELLWATGLRIFSLIIYVIMGWSAIFAVSPLIEALGKSGFYWLTAGGLFYTLGIGFFVTDHKVKHGHGVWHLFVLGGSICHYMAVLLYVV